MFLWVDDLREAPEGWEWAKNITEAFEALDNNQIEGVSLDLDIETLVSEGNGKQYGFFSEEKFIPVAKYIAAKFKPGDFPIDIHSSNEDAFEIYLKILKGWNLTLAPNRQAAKATERTIIHLEENS